MSIRVRIAPSPTGFVHIGNLRTILFNYFYARQQGGTFVIRIEDTDQKRFVPGALEHLLSTLQQLGLEHDEGPVLTPEGKLSEKGPLGPYIQSQRLELYKTYAEQLLESGHAYFCFCTAERLEEMRKQQSAAKQTPKYDRHCLKLSADEVKAKREAGEQHVIRMHVPDGATSFHDVVRGKITIDHREVDDQVLMKSDGFPTYHLAVVVDDHLMQITHVIRGEEWLPSTPKQILLYHMFGWDVPHFAHLPLLLNPDKTKLSKRQGDVAVEDYLKKGYLVPALLNFIGTLGFNPKGDQEIYQLSELISLFDLSKVNSAGAVLNVEKLDWMNHQYLMKLDQPELTAAARPFLTTTVENELVQRALLIERERVNRLNEFEEKIQPYLFAIEYDKALLTWKKSTPEDALQQLSSLRQLIADFEPVTFTQINLLETAIREYISNRGLQNGNVLWPLRVALSGAEKSASPFELLWVLQKDAALARIDTAISLLKS